MRFARVLPMFAMSRFALAMFVLVGGCDRTSTPSAGDNTATIVEPPIDKVAACKAALLRGDWATAERLSREHLLVSPGDPTMLEVAADVAAGRDDPERAIEFYQAAMEASEKPTVELCDKLGRQWMAQGKPFESVAVLAAAVEIHPDVPSLRRDLGGLQASLGLERRAAKHFRWLVQRGHGGPNVLIMLSDLSRPQTDEATCEYALKRHPKDLRPQYSLARSPAYESNWERVAEQLGPVVKRHPDFVEAQAYYGRALVEIGNEAGIRKWAGSLPAGIADQPQYWLAAGILAESHDQPLRAAGAFWNAVRLNEDDGESLSRLAASLSQIGRTDESKIVAARAGKITAMRDAVESLFSWNNDSQRAAVQIAGEMEQLGRQWEATAWMQAAFVMTQDRAENLRQAYTDVRSRLTGRTPWQTTDQLVAHRIDVGELPQIDWKTTAVVANTPTATVPTTKIRFDDQAQDRNLRHVCKINKPVGEEAGLWVYQSGAGGAAVLDFDMDGWPDVCLTTIDGQPKKENSGPNRLYQNHQGRFVEVTADAGIGDRGFAQGLAVGDYNADGFPDLMVANIGRNRLYRNNGDGTFSDVTVQSGLAGDDWTTSVVLVDINQDGHADLFEVGYCGGESLTQVCMDKKINQPRSCKPMAFPAQGDRVWQGTGDGTFIDVSEQWLGEHRVGRGFGIIAGMLDDAVGIDLLVANDMTANHLWSSQLGSAESFSLIEQAVVRGLAFDARSLSQASMGIAAGDANNDGHVDFYLTHFTNEYNTYYEQLSPGMWGDRTTQVGLATPTDSMLAYGAQWFDADNDGTDELMVANGNIDDFTHSGDGYRMPMQVFRRNNGGRWNSISAAELGEYFRTKRLGRSVVTLDVNRDGREDALVTHLFDPVSLLVNDSESDGKSIGLILKSSRGHPDAIGAQVHGIIAGRDFTSQLFAGDGYQCSREHVIRVGLGDADVAENVAVQWPGGRRESFGTVRGGEEYVLVEGSGEAFSLSR